MPLISQEYSLAPDMLFGWRPKNMGVGSPIPLDFTLEEAPVCENPGTGEEFLTIYHGYRPKDSLVMHRAYAGEASYPFQFSATYQGVSVGSKRDTREFVGMHPLRTDDLIFDSRFESGNLDRVVKVKDDEFDLYMRADANTRGHNQWFFFEVSCRRPQTVKFNLVNFTKQDSLYSQGMLPCVYSTQACAAGLSQGWHRAGEHVSYAYSKISRFSMNKRSYWQMSFTYAFQHEDDEVYFAYAIPYTFSRLVHLLKEFKRTVSERVLKLGYLCKSLSGVDVPLISISDFPVISPKQHIFITCRVHPGETHSSWVLEGLLRQLVSFEARAQQLRERFVFSIVPMLNPDGVILGNYRSCFAGNDLNRKYMDPDARLHSTVFSLKELINKAEVSGGLYMFLDLHAHSRRKNVFIYGPHYPLHSDKYFKMRVFPKLLSERSEMFRYFGCKFRNEHSKRKAARLVVWKEHKLPYSYTVEASFYGFLTPQRTTVSFNEDLLMKMGVAICDALLDYAQLLEAEQRRKERKRLARSRKKKRKGAVAEASDEELPPTRTLKGIIKSIRQETQLEDANNSGGSDSDPSQDELTEQEQLNLHSHINKAIDDFAIFSARPAQKSPMSRQRPPRKVAEGGLEARSSLSKYFSRAGQQDKYRKRTMHVKGMHIDGASFPNKKPLAASQMPRRLSACRVADEVASSRKSGGELGGVCTELKSMSTQPDKVRFKKKMKCDRVSLLEPLITSKTTPTAGFYNKPKDLMDVLVRRLSRDSNESSSTPRIREIRSRRRFSPSTDYSALPSIVRWEAADY
jgi:hypothetical protein